VWRSNRVKSTVPTEAPLNLRRYCHRADMLAALAGAWLIAAHVLKRRIARIMIDIHATLAVSDFVILVAYVFAE
jgi:hypothetical protein